MCNINDGFRLCTCQTENNPTFEIEWVVKRSNPFLPLQHHRGKAVVPHYNTQEQQLQTLLLNNLNAGNCFDFDYTPQTNDYLYIKGKISSNAEEKWFSYRYSNKRQWQIDSGNSLAGWKTQLEGLEKGKMV
ncbi:hypothetical protein [uncultured Microscilla sp.]|uniref:hypothetical protein n=1 Tax=uncultured Microscilla sp. TaxID=432653 RepID=UPI0026064DB0|nr:hypothetical protein [uncultured Microscilla sp.]